MSSDQAALSLDFLNNAAHLVRDTLPETSAHLMSERAAMMAKQGIAPSELQRQHVCVACGHIMVPGQGTELALDSRLRNQTRKNGTKAAAAAPSAAPTTGSRVVITCGHCHSKTRVALPAPDKAHHPKPTKRSAVQKPAAEEKATMPTANASSKKRAKNRKAGLQALLSAQKQPSGSLSLANFLKKG